MTTTTLFSDVWYLSDSDDDLPHFRVRPSAAAAASGAAAGPLAGQRAAPGAVGTADAAAAACALCRLSQDDGNGGARAERDAVKCSGCRNALCGSCLMNMDRPKIQQNIAAMATDGDIWQRLCSSAGEGLSVQCPFCKKALDPVLVRETVKKWLQRWLVTDGLEQLLLQQVVKRMQRELARQQGELLWQRTLQTERKRKLQRLLTTFS